MGIRGKGSGGGGASLLGTATIPRDSDIVNWFDTEIVIEPADNDVIAIYLDNSYQWWDCSIVLDGAAYKAMAASTAGNSTDSSGRSLIINGSGGAFRLARTSENNLLVRTSNSGSNARKNNPMGVRAYRL